MVLPAFVTGRKVPEPKPAEPARHRPEGALPPNERGMLVFVATLLGLGTLAVVIMLGLGSLTSDSGPSLPMPVTGQTGTPSPAAPPASALSSAAASSTTPSDNAVPSPTPSASTSPALKHPATQQASQAPSLLGPADAEKYCAAVLDNSRPTRHWGQGWTCASRHSTVPFTADQVCDQQYGQSSHAVVGSSSDWHTWKCYR